MDRQERELTLRDLYRSLDERWRPEDVAQKIIGILTLNNVEWQTIELAAKAGRENFYFTMSRDFHRPCGMDRQLKVATELFGRSVNFTPNDVAQIDAWIEETERSIGKSFGKNDFKTDRLPKSERKKAGIDISRRQYNKRFRLAVRLEKKARKLAREQFKRSLTLASKTRLASKITWEDFSSDLNTACLIAYYVARCNLRSLFTNTSQARPYDEICEALMQRCNQKPDSTNWWAIAHVLPNEEIVSHLDDEQKGVLLADYFNLMTEAAEFLRQLWAGNEFNEDMVVRKGNDSTTWNVAAGAWNKLRDGWFSLMYALSLFEAVEQMCPGKVLRLMAADVAYWHRMSGGGVHNDTLVWKEMPHPWQVVSGDVQCPKSQVDAICGKHGLDPVKSGWSAPKPGRTVEKFEPTPELVHGVVVASPLLASVFRKAGVFSGNPTKRSFIVSTVNDIRWRHWTQQIQRKEENDKATK